MILTKINIPADLKGLHQAELNQLCEELRHFMQNSTLEKEGHINSSLGVTELTVALHYIFNTPQDILIWDVGHQAYIHKILTGRKNVFPSNRTKGGISGFTKSGESEYDPFGAGHSSTSISAISGFAQADKLLNIKRHRIAVIGDGAITGGMSFEALNYIGDQQLDVLMILNDNSSSIDANVGSLAKNNSYQKYCDALNINFLGTVDGHEMGILCDALIKSKSINGPKMLRVLTQKSKGRIRIPKTGKTSNPSFQDVFSSTMIHLGKINNRMVAISPAMLSGSGLDLFQKKFPDRTFDVGIAEQHAVTMAAGLAAAGMIPVVHLYSTFSQRAYDQIIHDVALQNLHVVFCLDRAGLVGEDGATHHGNFDPGFLNTIPNINFLAPMDGQTLHAGLVQAVNNKGVWVIRYPKAELPYPVEEELETVKTRLIKAGSGKAVLSFGAIGAEVIKALTHEPFAHYDFPFLKPLDKTALSEIAKSFDEIITVEENSPRGGFGDSVRAFFEERNIRIKVKSLALPDAFIDHASRQELLESTHLDASGIKEQLRT